MPRIEPFQGILYNPKKVEISKVVAPPYDVISPQLQNELYLADEHNIVRLILGKEEPADSKSTNKYTRAKKFYNDWLKKKILMQDKTHSIYVYSQEYLHENKKKGRLGFIARMKIEDPRESRVLPHEYTFAKPKQDRLNLLRQVKANLSPIFTLFNDEQNKVMRLLKSVLKKKPLIDVEQEGVRHKLWRIENRKLIIEIEKNMRDKDIFIADGHHRYEVALMYRDEMRAKKRTPNTEHRKPKTKNYDYVMMYFSPLNQDGMTILSTHRVIRCLKIDIDEFIKKLERCFQVEQLKSAEALFKKMASVKKGFILGVYFKHTPLFLKLKDESCLDSEIKDNKSSQWKRLDVSILHGLIFDNILGLREKSRDEECVIYTRDPEYAKREVDKRDSSVAFFLNPTKISQVSNIAKLGDKMPHKSTYFYPKPLSGLVINNAC